ncbi:MAG: hypothetical protein GY810_26265 [Aureispira sp.]|nr:hypothetical protein [Aureispira sp.]
MEPIFALALIGVLWLWVAVGLKFSKQPQGLQKFMKNLVGAISTTLAVGFLLSNDGAGDNIGAGIVMFLVLIIVAGGVLFIWPIVLLIQEPKLPTTTSTSENDDILDN